MSSDRSLGRQWGKERENMDLVQHLSLGVLQDPENNFGPEAQLLWTYFSLPLSCLPTSGNTEEWGAGSPGRGTTWSKAWVPVTPGFPYIESLSALQSRASSLVVVAGWFCCFALRRSREDWLIWNSLWNLG